MDISNLSGTKVIDLTVDAVLQWLICGVLSLVTITSLSMGLETVYELHFICYMFSFLSELRVGYTIFYGLISFVHNSFTTVYSTTCMYAMRKFALCECYCLFSYSLQVCCGRFM